MTLDRCDRCGGLWFDVGELNQVLEVGGAAIVEKLAPTGERPGAEYDDQPGACPRCDDEQMQRVTSVAIPELGYDICPGCGGTWLDAGELAALDDALRG